MLGRAAACFLRRDQLRTLVRMIFHKSLILLLKLNGDKKRAWQNSFKSYLPCS
jgi:hypothetical protein